MANAPGGATAPTDPRPPIPREIKVLIASAFVIAIGFGLVSPVLPQYARSFDVGVAAASVIVSAFAFMRLVFAPAGGALIARLGERPVYLVGLLVVAVSTGACAFAQSYGQLLVFRGLGGIGSTMFTVSAMGLIVRLTPPSIRGRVSSAYATAFLIGNIAGPIAGGLMAGWGYRVPFLVYAVSLLVAAGVVAVFLSNASLRPPPGTPPLEPLAVADVLGDSAYRASLVSAFANGWANFGVRVALLPMFAAAVVSLGAVWAGPALTLFAVGNALALNVSGRLVDARGRKQLILVGLFVGAAATGVTGWATTLPAFLALSLVGGVGAGLLNPAQQAAVADVVGQGRNGGKVLAAFQMAQDSGAILGPIVAGRIADAWGFGAAFAVTGVVLFVAALAWLPARETFVRAVERSEPAPS
ncbi:MFS transporter [Agilicoccus flavus]|uniref:MFS transporter n=1 Tax=Agilicoccus flavus TaxID=2775968 RepID=UPI001CF7100B|nr:MFS transporter [Agilicoccus flavus]